MKTEGRVWRFGDDVNTDLIIPGRYLDNYEPAHLAAHAMEGVDKDFASKVRKGDVIAAGRNFGCGSSREQAVIALKHAGVQAVLAKSFARIFYRNAINLGLPVIVSPDASDVLVDGETVVLDDGIPEVVSADGSRMARLEPVPERALEILRSGGLMPHIRKQLGEGST